MSSDFPGILGALPSAVGTTRAVRHIYAPRSLVYRALLDADAVQQWMVPAGMTSAAHSFDGREGGTFRISLTSDFVPKLQMEILCDDADALPPRRRHRRRCHHRQDRRRQDLDHDRRGRHAHPDKGAWYRRQLKPPRRRRLTPHQYW